MTKPIPGLIVRTKAGNVKVLCQECLSKSEYEEIVDSFKSFFSSRCVKCNAPVVINHPDPAYRVQLKRT